MKDKTLATAAYLFWIPALYIILTSKRKESDIGFHGGQALVLWTWIFIIFFSFRFLVNLVWGFVAIPGLDILENILAISLWGYAAYCGWRCFQGIYFKIPY